MIFCSQRIIEFCYQNFQDTIIHLENIIQDQNTKIIALESTESKLLSEMKRKGDAARQMMKEKDKEIDNLKNQLRMNTVDVHTCEETSTPVSTMNDNNQSTATIDELLTSDEVS